MLCQEKTAPGDRFLGPSVKLSEGLFPTPSAATGPVFPSFSPLALGVLALRIQLLFCTWLGQGDPVTEVRAAPPKGDQKEISSNWKVGGNVHKIKGPGAERGEGKSSWQDDPKKNGSVGFSES